MMVRTLKITTFVAAVLCLVLIITVAAFGLRGDSATEQALAAPSVIESLRKVLESAPNAGDQVSPLVLHAKGFAFRINPPPPPPPRVAERPPVAVAGNTPKAPISPPRPPEPRAPVAARFDVIATCRYDDDPGKSMALLNLPGKGLKWVTVGENVEHLVLAGVKDGRDIMAQPTGTESTVDMKQEPSMIKSLLAMGNEPIATAGSAGGGLDGAIWQPPARPVTVKKGSAYVPPPPGTTRTYSPVPGRRIPSVARTPGGYVPPTGSRTRTPPPEPTLAQRKAALDDNIGDIKKIMESSVGEGDEQAKQEQEALMRLLQLLEGERKAAETEAEADGK